MKPGLWGFLWSQPESVRGQGLPASHGESRGSAAGAPSASVEICLPSGKPTKKLWKITMINGKIHYKLSFSIATLNYQRVICLRHVWRSKLYISVAGPQMFESFWILNLVRRRLRTTTPPVGTCWVPLRLTCKGLGLRTTNHKPFSSSSSMMMGSWDHITVAKVSLQLIRRLNGKLGAGRGHDV